MILDGWFYTGAVIGILSAIICILATIIRDHPADSSIISLGAVELFLVVYAVYALISSVPLNGPGWEFWGYIITGLLLPPIAFFWGITDKTRWSNLVMAAIGPTILVMIHRLQVIWHG
ncbi:MAG: hypothetical protein HLX51_11015 [Micrococcaceae bacterium]|nr:hypothetical protein [Micrococcaceae bacterium]